MKKQENKPDNKALMNSSPDKPGIQDSVVSNIQWSMNPNADPVETHNELQQLMEQMNNNNINLQGEQDPKLAGDNANNEEDGAY
jgi:hypothetical protein